MSWDTALGELRNQLPPFNEYLLRGFRREQVSKFPEFMSMVFGEAVQLFEGNLKYLGYRTLSPDKRTAYQIYPETGINKGRYNIQQSELELIEFEFEYEGQIIPVHLNLPYLHNECLVINDTKYFIQHAIIERMIYRATDEIVIKVMRSPIQFWRTEQLVYMDTTGTVYHDCVITVKAHYRKEHKITKTPLMLYLLSIKKFKDVVTDTFGLSPEAIKFVRKDNPTDKRHRYFKCNDESFLRVETELMKEISLRRFVASILAIVKYMKRFTVEDLNKTVFYKTVLGKNIYGVSTKEALAAGHADGHLDSLKTYLDPNTKRELSYMKIYCNNIFDLFETVFFNIDQWLVGYSPNDLFEKRLGGADLILMDLVKAIFTRFYDTLKKNKQLNIKNIRSMLKIDPMRITQIWKVPTLQTASSLYNDNILISAFCKKQRHSSSQESSKKSNNLINNNEHRFHTSFVAIESALAISVSNPGVAGEINPYAQIDNLGCFRKDLMPWYKDLDELQKYLPQV